MAGTGLWSGATHERYSVCRFAACSCLVPLARHIVALSSTRPRQARAACSDHQTLCALTNRVLELRCPLLLTLHMQACRQLPWAHLRAAVEGCGDPIHVDVQHVGHPQEDLVGLQRGRTSLRHFLVCGEGCTVCRQREA